MQCLDERQHSAAEEDKAFGIVGIVAMVVPVQPWAIEVRILLDTVYWHCLT
jgi:hypothetical protein